MFKNIKSNIDNLWTPESKPPPGYKLIIHRYYTEIVKKGLNVPKTPVKTRRFLYESENDNKTDINK